jgi:hypothetical protein
MKWTKFVHFSTLTTTIGKIRVEYMPMLISESIFCTETQGISGVTCAFRPGASVVLANTLESPVMTVLRTGVWGCRAWYVVAWLDNRRRRWEAFFPQEDLKSAEAVLAG